MLKVRGTYKGKASKCMYLFIDKFIDQLVYYYIQKRKCKCLNLYIFFFSTINILTYCAPFDNFITCDNEGTSV